jgi:hypothetical protein
MADRSRTPPPPRDYAHDGAEASLYETGHGRARWGAIFAGTIYALALYVLLTVIGLGLGLTIFEPDEASPLNGSLTTTAIWQFLSQLVALGVGGYAAGRFAGILHPMGSMLHGALVWSLTTLVSVWIATSAIVGIANIAGSAVSGLFSGVSSAADAVIPEDFSLPDLSVPSVEMSDLPPGVRSTLRENGLTPDNLQAELLEAFRNVVSEGEQAALRRQATETAGAILSSPGDIGEDLEGFVDATFGRGAILSQEDRAEALAVLERRFGVTPAEAEAVLDSVAARAEAFQEEAAQTLQETQDALVEAADAAADATATAAWLVALASILGLIAAVGGAYFGRPGRT